MYEWAFFFHLVGAILFFAGLAVAAVEQATARRRTRPSEVALLLRIARWSVVMWAPGRRSSLGFGPRLVDITAHRFDGWVLASLALLALPLVAGAAGGQAPKRAPSRARLASERDEASAEIDALLREPLSDALSWAAAAAAVAILVLML